MVLRHDDTSINIVVELLLIIITDLLKLLLTIRLFHILCLMRQSYYECIRY